MPQYRERYDRLGESEWFKKHYEGKSISEEDLKLDNLLEERSINILQNLIDNQKDLDPEIQQAVNDNFWDLVACEPNIDIIDHSPRYTKTEIENRLYRLIDDENIFPPEEDIHIGAAYKLLNALLDSLE